MGYAGRIIGLKYSNFNIIRGRWIIFGYILNLTIALEIDR